MTHDPMCPKMPDHIVVWTKDKCQCDLIAAVRADMVQRVEVLGYYIDSSDPFEQGYTIGRAMAIDVLNSAVIGS